MQDPIWDEVVPRNRRGRQAEHRPCGQIAEVTAMHLLPRHYEPGTCRSKSASAMTEPGAFASTGGCQCPGPSVRLAGLRRSWSATFLDDDLAHPGDDNWLDAKCHDLA